MVFTSHYSHLVEPSPTVLHFLWTGVDLFFVISGFVFGPLIQSGRVRIAPYALRRFFRIYPLYCASLLVYYLLATGGDERHLLLLRHLAFLGTTTNAHDAFFFNPAYWSLPVEVEFYLLLPLLALLVAGRTARLVLVLGLWILLRAWIAVHATSFSVAEPNLFSLLRVHLPGILGEFLVGTLCYDLYRRACAWRNPRAARRLAMVLGLMGMLLWLWLWGFFTVHGNQGVRDSQLLTAYFSPLCALSYALILFGALVLLEHCTGWCQRLALALGAGSYGVYLLHWLVLGWYRDAGLALTPLSGYLLCAGATLALATAGYFLIERPLRDLGRAWARTLAGRKQRVRNC